MEDLIPKRLACLYIDVDCYRCKRLMALSNSVEIDGRKYCFQCSEVVKPIEEILKELEDVHSSNI